MVVQIDLPVDGRRLRYNAGLETIGSEKVTPPGPAEALEAGAQGQDPFAEFLRDFGIVSPLESTAPDPEIEELRVEFEALRADAQLAAWSPGSSRSAESRSLGRRRFRVREVAGGPLEHLTGAVTLRTRDGVTRDQLEAELGGTLKIVRRLRFARGLFQAQMPFGEEPGLDAAVAHADRIAELNDGNELLRWIEPDLRGFDASRQQPPWEAEAGWVDQRRQWKMLRCPGAWERGRTGAGVEIGIVDLGFEPANSDLIGAVSEWSGYYLANGRLVNDVVGMPDESHGTQVAGMAAAQLNGTGVCGVAFGARLRLVALSATPGRPRSALGRAIAYLVDPRHEAPRAKSNNGVRVISCSLGPREHTRRRLTRVMRLALDAANRAGIPVFWAVAHATGAAHSDEIIAHDGVYGVGAVGVADGRYRGGATGPALEFVGPGWDVHTTTSDGLPRGSASPGTVNGGPSLAAPCAAGVAALVAQDSPALRGTDIVEILRRTCRKAPADVEFQGQPLTRHPEYGHGILNAARAVRAAQRR